MLIMTFNQFLHLFIHCRILEVGVIHLFGGFEIWEQLFLKKEKYAPPPKKKKQGIQFALIIHIHGRILYKKTSFHKPKNIFHSL